MVENSFNKKIKSIRSNKGGEYIKGYFQSFCELEGIQMEHSVLLGGRLLYPTFGIYLTSLQFEEKPFFHYEIY